MPGERWPDKRARAVLFAGANKLRAAGLQVDADGIADTGLLVRDQLFVDHEVREDNADVKANRIGYSADCMQFATLEAAADGVALSLWLGPDGAKDARAALGATDDPNPFRRLYGWVRILVAPGAPAEPLHDWAVRARRHSADTKRHQEAQPRRP